MLGLLVTTNLMANQVEQKLIDAHLDDQRIQTETTVITPQRQSFQKPKHQADKLTPKERTLSISKEELVKHPDLVLRALVPALTQGNVDNVALLFPIYQQLPEQFLDEILIRWGKAVLARQAQNYSESIRLYREIIAIQADILPVRLQLAIALFENNELEAAEDQFQKLRSEPLGVEVKAIINEYLKAIQHRNRWTFGGGLTFLHDPNINNAPKAGTTYGNWSPPKAEKAQGIGVNVNIGKKWSWGNGFFNELRLGANGKYYWNNHKYNEGTFRVSLGAGFQNAKWNVALLPFMDKVFYAGGGSNQSKLQPFSNTKGGTLEVSYWLSPKWQINATYEYGKQRYDVRKHLNGHYHFASGSLVYLASAKQYWFAGVNYNRTQTRDLDDSFSRRGGNIGWGQEWGKGLSTRLSLNLAEKQYKGPMLIFGMIQRNKEYGLQASIWHRAVHLWGVTPRLTYNYNKTKSNHVFYTYDKHRFFVELSKQF